MDLNKSPAEILEQAKELIALSKYEEALVKLEKIHQVFPTNHVYIYQLADLYEKLGQFEKQSLMLEKFIKYAPIPDEACPKLGETYYKLDQFAKMVDAHKRCWEMNTKNPDYLFFLGLSFERYKDLKRSEKIYKTGSLKFPKYVDFYTGLGRMMLSKGKKKEALRLAEKALEIQPDHADALLLAGSAKRLLRDYTAAKRNLFLALEGHPDYVNVLTELAETYSSLKDRPHAIYYFNEALAQDPDNKMINKRIHEIEDDKTFKDQTK